MAQKMKRRVSKNTVTESAPPVYHTAAEMRDIYQKNKKSIANYQEAMEADSELNKAVSKLFALAESYPDLKANTNFLQMQDELKETENKIASARQFYNDVVLQYNNKIQMFPSNIIAGLFGFKTESFFEANKEERENVKVKF